MKEKIENWIGEVTKLSSIATTHPQEAYAALTHGLTGKWVYFMQMIPNIADMMKPLEDAIRLKLIPAVTGKPGVSDLMRNLLTLSAHLGGLNIPNPSTMSSKEYKASVKVTAALVDAICQQSGYLNYSTVAQQINSKSEVWKEKREAQSVEVRRLRPLLSQEQQKLLEIASEK